MVEGALNAAAEQLVEVSAHGRLMQRQGNRAPHAAPQGLYACRDHDVATQPRWLALSVESDAQWRALTGVLGAPEWAREAALATLAGRREAHDRIDVHLAAWFAERDRDEAVDVLVSAGVPAAALADPRTAATHPQMVARGFFEACTHPVVGTHPLPTVPFRYRSVDRWLRGPAPTLGQHNRGVLRDVAGLTDAEVDDLEAAGVIGTRLRVA
jgi:crotonobetainyl-CoA:carnitine CoA-transferase CaiB-like acyl-CoA transferase